MIAVISHDAGGAEILSSWLRRQAEPCCLVLDGPARAIFRCKVGAGNTYSLSDALSKCDWVLCGTSWQSDLERRAIKQARTAKKKTVAFLDHWVNYPQRFQDNGVLNLPDEIWVGDPDALRIAREHFPSTPVKLLPNPYFDDLRLELEKVKPPVEKAAFARVLYVCEPLRQHALLQYGNERHWGYTQEEALEYFLSHTEAFGVRIGAIKVRPHPSEEKGAYSWAKRLSPIIQSGGKQPLIEEVAAADIVVGCASMAMVVGLLAGKRVISCIPPGGQACSLPQKEIEHLQALVANHSKKVHNA